MVRNLTGFGAQSGRQNQFNFITTNSPRRSALTEDEKNSKVENLKQYFEDVTDSQLRQTLIKCNWDDEASHEVEMKKALIKKEQDDTQAMLLQKQQVQQHLSSQQNQPRMNNYVNCQPARPTKRKRAQFEQNQMQQSEPNQQPFNTMSNSQAPVQIETRQILTSSSQLSVQNQQQVVGGSLEQKTNELKRELPEKLIELLMQQNDKQSSVTLVEQALEHFTKERDPLLVQEVKSSIMSSNEQENSKDKRLLWENEILKKGVNALSKRTNEWCKTEKQYKQNEIKMKETAEEQQHEINNLQFKIMLLQK